MHQKILSFYEDIWNGNNDDAINLLIDDDLNEGNDVLCMARGKRAFRSLVQCWHDSFVDIKETPIRSIISRDTAMVLFRFQGTLVASFRDITCIGKRVTFYGTDYFKFDNDQIREWSCIEDWGSKVIEST